MTQYHASCHCGAITFDFEAPPITTAIRCDCSMCLRKATVLSPFTLAPDEIAISAPEGAMRTYQFGTMKAKHHFCGICGIHTFVETYLKPGHFRINLGCVDGLDAYGFPEKIFEGSAL